jgi:protein-disulfide reductase (glutathione)
MRARLAVGIVLSAVLLLPAARAFAGAENWNDANIRWMSYDDGLAAAKKQHKPICLIFYTTWCPHCANYAKVFSDPKVVEKSKSFVMIRLDKDKNQELSKKYSPDGEYIPRTYFLSSNGQLEESLTEGRAQYKYFYSESDPASILAGMDRALQKLK